MIISASEYANRVEGSKGNCWMLARDWLKENSRSDFIDEVHAYAKDNGWDKAEKDLLNPIWFSKKFENHDDPQSGDLALLRSSNGWGLGVVVDEETVICVDAGNRYVLRSPIEATATFMRL